MVLDSVMHLSWGYVGANCTGIIHVHYPGKSRSAEQGSEYMYL